MKSAHHAVLTAFLLVASLGFPEHLLAQAAPAPGLSNAGLMLVAKVTGRATMTHAGSTVALAMNMVIPAGAKLNTGLDSSVILASSDGSALRLGSDSELTADTHADQSTAGQLSLNRGELIADVKHPAGAPQERLRVRTPVGALSNAGGVFRVVFRPATTGAAFFQATSASGILEYSHPQGGAPVIVRQGQEISITVAVTANPTGGVTVTATPAGPSNATTLGQITVATTDLAGAITAAASPAPLSPATQQKLAKMRPLFDGKTLEGWIQAPPAPVNFSSNDIVDRVALVKKISERADPVAAWLGGQAEGSLETNDAKQAMSALVRTLNRIVGGESIYEAARFRGVALRPETEALRRKNPPGLELARLNRLLLEDAFPRELARSPSASWIVKDGAMASTGGGRGVIYTQDDFTRYRLIFTMRHVSGNPDHQPCVLVFCTRPAPGERGLDALAGIQFQTPNGGHWDYRPGHNNAGNDYFTRPVRTTFDNHQWHQVEILVDAKTGIARMAVAQPVGTRAVENCVFRDPSAGKTGPLAWQMHNAGLFDEFKDVRIEIDPVDDRLITVE